MYTLDTNAIIYYLKGDKTANLILDKIFSDNLTVYISTITQIELLGFFNITAQELEQIEELLKTVAIIPLDSNIAQIAGFLRRSYSIHIADSAIAATALFTGTTLITRDTSHFNKIPNLTVKKI